MGNEASTLMNELQTNIESKLERFQPIQITTGYPRDEPVEPFPATCPVTHLRRMHSEDVKQALENDDQDGQKTFTEAVQRAKTFDIPEVTESQKAAIRASWTALTNEIESIGVLTFLHMFERHPNMRNNFKSFKHLSHQELQSSEIFHNHAARVVNVVKKVVEKLDTPEVYINYLTTLGRKHIMYEAEPELLDQIGYLFLTSIKAILEREYAWDEETSDAWECLLIVILGTMRKGMNGHGG